MDRNIEQLKPLFEQVYAQDAEAWWQRWRIFFMAYAELFGFEQVQEWVVGDFLFKKKVV